MARISKKSVSFSEAEKASSPTPPDSGTGEPIPRFEKSIYGIPFHSILVIYGMFHYGLTQNVNDVLFQGLLTLIPINIIYGYILVKTIKPKKLTKKAKRKDEEDNIIILIIGSLIMSVVLSIPIFVGLILFGAPLNQLLEGTYLLSLHLSLVIFYPLLIVYKYNSYVWTSIFSLSVPIKENQIVLISLCGLIGTWFGVFPIPLDWDRDWQQWPITLVVGAYLGVFIGGFVSLIF